MFFHIFLLTTNSLSYKLIMLNVRKVTEKVRLFFLEISTTEKISALLYIVVEEEREDLPMDLP